MAKTRTFIAVEASAELRAAAHALIAQLQPRVPDVRWTPEENLHYTLAFLGDITDQEIVEVCSRVSRVAEQAEPFLLKGTGVGAFPTLQRPRTLWIGAGEGGDALCKLQSQVEAAIADLGFRGENRRYMPHLTIGKLGRHARAASPELADELSRLTAFEGGATLVDAVTIFSSDLQREGPEYHVLASCPLGQ